ncbi:MAG: hypothetical protein ACO331_02435 [Prochlorothrix sp.]
MPQFVALGRFSHGDLLGDLLTGLPCLSSIGGGASPHGHNLGQAEAVLERVSASVTQQLPLHHPAMPRAARRNCSVLGEPVPCYSPPAPRPLHPAKPCVLLKKACPVGEICQDQASKLSVKPA